MITPMKTSFLGLFLLLSASLTPLTSGAFTERAVSYEVDGVSFEGTVVFDADEDDKRPGILMVPNWMGPATEGTREKARKIAGDDYIVFIVDMYGTEVRPKSGEEAGRAAGEVRADRELMRARAAKALEAFLELEDEIPLKADQIAAIGFCFGGGAVLELGRSGADLDAIVSFHGDLLSPTLEADAGKTKASVLVLHGAADPVVPQDDVRQFVDTMGATDVDWQLVQFGGAVHSFTDPTARSGDAARYDARTAKRAFEMMEDLFKSVWKD